LEWDLAEPEVRKRQVTISVGAAVLPQQAANHFLPLDVGPFRGQRAGALRRLATYAAQPHSGVDILRVGMEDTPYAVGLNGDIELADNIRLLGEAIGELEANGARVELNQEAIFERMGLSRVQLGLLSALQATPLGTPESPMLEVVAV
jgi:hypothetical protein